MILLSDILKSKGVFSKEIKTRIANKQILVNGNPVDNDVKLDIDFWGQFVDSGEFVSQILQKNQIWFLRIKFLGIDALMSGEIENDLTEFLNEFIFIRISKKESFFLKKKMK